MSQHSRRACIFRFFYLYIFIRRIYKAETRRKNYERIRVLCPHRHAGLLDYVLRLHVYYTLCIDRMNMYAQ